MALSDGEPDVAAEPPRRHHRARLIAIGLAGLLVVLAIAGMSALGPRDQPAAQSTGSAKARRTRQAAPSPVRLQALGAQPADGVALLDETIADIYFITLATFRMICCPVDTGTSAHFRTRTSSGVLYAIVHSGVPRPVYLRMLTARAMTSATVPSEISDWAPMVSLASWERGKTSVGLNAVALVSERYR